MLADAAQNPECCVFVSGSYSGSYKADSQSQTSLGSIEELRNFQSVSLRSLLNLRPLRMPPNCVCCRIINKRAIECEGRLDYHEFNKKVVVDTGSLLWLILKCMCSREDEA